MERKHWLLAGLFLWLIAIYSPALREHPTLRYDDREILAPLGTVRGLDDYVRAIREYRVPDLQPVRDLGFWVELKIEDATGFRNSQAVNLALWIAILALVFALLELEATGSPWNFPILCLLALHPVVTSTVAWTTARKHLLAALFILLATWFSEHRRRDPRSRLATLVFYLLSVLSQPIHWPWIFWFLFFSRSKPERRDRNDLIFTGSLLAAALAVVVLNFLYYSGRLFPGAPVFEAPKINEESFTNLLRRFLALGRYAYQIFVPAQVVALPYGLFQAASGVGLALIGFAVLVWRYFIPRTSLAWLAWSLIPVAMMTIWLTHHGGFDPYIFLTVIGLAIFAAVHLKDFTLGRKGLATIAVLGTIYSALSWNQVRVWTSDEALFAQAYGSEGTLLATTGLAEVLLSDGKADQASSILDELSLRDPANRELPRLHARLLFMREIPDDRKAKLFAERETPDPWYQYYFAAFEASHGRFQAAQDRLVKSQEKDPAKFRAAFRGQETSLFGIWEKICARADANACPRVREIKKSFSEN